ncbi:Fur family transcriptional regulator [Streptomyces spectabilis]|uniref:Fur family ferric uptake transcriptional regulator n=1 Tax=Streptomyces spectabilis TaxID=68270 RepID=A0A7W8AXZ0_STRST|nr:transcriptional repressor [Streptomyces spectabilis]MBB5106562.1 Fur family ferric uptake transcriptional regulator [Streptomyces spectabilis]MCI3903581.1 transcriptional repressor [Streptomyces spectabilis]
MVTTDPDATTDWKSDLRQRGYRLTPQRQLVLEAVDKLEHATPDDILCEVRRTASGVNISTVYRTLELLEELGLVSHAHLGHGAPTYHLADRHHHIHLVCRDCTAVIEADVEVAADFTAKLRATFGFDTDMKHFAIFGRCGTCATDGPAAARDDSDEATGAASRKTSGESPGEK